eukprot:1986814-Heterocapsa_arctica.AAC.1
MQKGPGVYQDPHTSRTIQRLRDGVDAARRSRSVVPADVRLGTDRAVTLHGPRRLAPLRAASSAQHLHED